MLINGEKYACEACVRGHRVSSCHHSDRQLMHVNKKGRPVSQCHHCRGMRKSRSSHVHCECSQKGHSKEDCPHDKADGKHEPGTCCCQHTSKCTCAAKKDHLESVPEDFPQIIQPKDPHKRLSNHNSHDSKPTVFTNGHHKPVHKFNDSHNQFGSPYKIPSRSHTVHGNREIAQRSTDSLPLTTKFSQPHKESPLHSIMNAESTRQVRSEHNSPILQATIPANDSISNFNIPPFDPSQYSYSPFGNSSPDPLSQSGLPTNTEEFPDDLFMSYEEAKVYQPPKWYTEEIHETNENLPVTRNNNISGMQSSTYGAFDPFNQFNFLNNVSGVSSGDISEAEEFSPGNPRPGILRSVSQEASNDLSSNGGDDVSERYRLSSASSYYGTPQANVPASENLANLDIDDVIKQAEDETRKMQMQNQQYQLVRQNGLAFSEEIQVPQGQRPSNASSSVASPRTVMHPFTIHEAQEYAHMNDNQNMQVDQKPLMPPTSMAEDPAWSAAPDMSNPTLSLDGDEQEDEDWVR